MKTTKVNVYTLNGKLLRSFVPGTGFAQPKKSKRVVFEFDERDMDALKNMAINGNYSHWMETRKQQYLSLIHI